MEIHNVNVLISAKVAQAEERTGFDQWLLVQNPLRHTIFVAQARQSAT